MHDDDAPKRLSQDSDPELRLALRRTAERAPESERVARIARNVAAATGLPPELLLRSPSEGSVLQPDAASLEPLRTAGVQGALGAGGKIAAASTIAVVAGLLGYWASTGSPTSLRLPEERPALVLASSSPPAVVRTEAAPAPRPRAHTAGNAPASAAPPSSPSAAPVVLDGTASSPPPPREEPRTERPRVRELRDVRAAKENRAAHSARQTATSSEQSSASATPSSEPVQPTAADELGLLHLAQSALQTSPSRASYLIERHRREFPRSALSQERELIHISALVRLGRVAEAQSRAARFRAAYPRSAYERQLNVILPAR
jgi:hypothetical protein